MSVDRAHDLAVIKRACTDGRITLGEFSAAARAILAGDEASPVVDDEGSADLAPDERVLAVLGTARHRIRRVTTGRLSAIAVFGGCEVDLSDARIYGDELVVDVAAVFGTVKVVVPAGIEVRVKGTPVLGTTKDLTDTSVDPLPGAPVVIVRAVPACGTVKVLHR